MESTPAVALRRPFDPAAHELDPNFRLTKFADLKGWGCKVPQEVLLKLLEGLQPDSSAQAQEQAHFQYVAQIPRMGKFFSLFSGSSFAIIGNEQIWPLIEAKIRLFFCVHWN